MTLQITVPDMACSACSKTITDAIKSVDPQASVTADPATKLVTVETQAAPGSVKQAITAAGYSVT
jgi:copper chaperone